MPSDHSPFVRKLYPPIEPWAAWHMQTGDGHEIYVEQSGARDGIPVIFVHGGPGGGTGPAQRRFFDPKKYHIIIFDQRGCGRSRPFASLDNNTTWHLVADMEAIRTRLGLEKWILFGGSWGSTLSLIYAETHPERVSALVLRGIFMSRQEELDWFYKHGTGKIFPELWHDFKSYIPADEQDDLIQAYHQRLTGEDEAIGLEAAQKWSVWETSCVTLVPDLAGQSRAKEAAFALPFARIETHYFVNKCFLETDTFILDNTSRIQHIPTWIVHGRYDAICPASNAADLAEALPDAVLKIVPVAGHSAFETPLIDELVKIMDDIELEDIV